MSKTPRLLPTLLAFLAIMPLLMSCSTQKNTSASRWWHSFNARYNTYFNGSQAFIEGSQEKESGFHDNFTEQLPLYAAGTKTGKDIGKQKFDRAIEKAEKAIKRHSIKRRPQWTKQRRKTERDIEWLGRKEYNPFIWKAWLMLGKSQFQKGEFEEAAATFSYMTRLYATQPAINGISRAWLAKSYSELGWLYDAEDVITKMKRDSMHYRAVADWDYAYCDYYLHSGQRREAIKYLKRVIGHERRRILRARQYYILGQLYAAEGERDAAYKAFRKVIRMSPPYELSFNARIAQTEVMAKGQSKKTIGKLKRMASSDNNKDYQEQIYYAIGNIHLMNGDTLKAISAYEEGNKKATRSGIEKGVLLLTLGNIYWQRQNYIEAQRCYGEAIGLLDKDRPDYNELSIRSKQLDDLVPHLSEIHLQDSLRYLASASEEERNAAIDRQIEMLKRKEKEERDAQQEKEAEKQQSMSAQDNRQQQNKNVQNTTNDKTSATWYFYNPMAVSQGKAAFERLWGRRENTDDWRRSNQTVVKLGNDAQEEANDSITTEGELQDNDIEKTNDSGQEKVDDASDPHKRAYYLANIPLTEEQMKASDTKLEEALLNAGIILKDKLDAVGESRKRLERLLADFGNSERNDETCYHLFLVYSRLGLEQQANAMIDRLKSNHPESQYTTLLSNPHYLEDARWGEHIEDSIYTATYEAFKQGKNDIVKANAKISDERFEQGYNRARFLLISALTMLNEGEADECVRRMTEIVEKHPTSEVAEMAGMIVKGVQQGKKLQGGGFGMGDVWSRRSTEAAKDTTVADTLSRDLNIEHVVMLAFRTDSIDTNQTLYELAKYNFTNYLVRNFEIVVEGAEGLTRMTISGFANYDEAMQYRQQLIKDFMPMLKNRSVVRLYVVSEQNLKLLGSSFSFYDYEKFYNDNLAPVKTSDQPLLTEPTEVVGKENADEDDTDEDNPDDEQEDNGDDDNMFDFEEDFYR